MHKVRRAVCVASPDSGSQESDQCVLGTKNGEQGLKERERGLTDRVDAEGWCICERWASPGGIGFFADATHNISELPSVQFL